MSKLIIPFGYNTVTMFITLVYLGISFLTFVYKCSVSCLHRGYYNLVYNRSLQRCGLCAACFNRPNSSSLIDK